ncbi:biotin-dependent carboxyltransferase family protein [Pedobacter frigidisoli]|uniref:Biotin-dependent carboxyltransferase family protein n=1 Tax=Pedobacter frigidisoli TaxID=2530455 RepID=A0A4R0NZ11_9SPHI|nr:biotin-dependent carboxyltransferase family protein [Pedobacter frigidisoli]TCD05604.1 biotin-dependent carboxyltransferase family protein [Pedobacter frigidisoli]
MQIKILKPGILSTIQDLGRMDFLSQAVPTSGAMDTLSARIANKAVGNPDDFAVIEFTYAAAELETLTDVLVAYAGDGAILSINGNNLPSERPLFIPKGNTIKLKNNPDGARTYLSIVGGWAAKTVMGSKSTYLTAGFGGHYGRSLIAGDVLSNDPITSQLSKTMIKKLKSDTPKFLNWSIPKTLLLSSNRKVIRVFPGREFSKFNGLSITNFFSSTFKIAVNSNRMGFHLEGNLMLQRKKEELLSTAVAPGTIQVTGSGNLILLMADCQTTGGYPRIAQVAAVDLTLCAQLKPGDSLQFEDISTEDAEILYLEREKELNKLTTAISSRF